MQTWQIVAAVVVVVLIGALLAWLFARRQRSRQLAERFGPEYARTVETTGDRGAAERELAARQERMAEVQISELAPAQRERHAAEWDRVQAEFVDDPAGAVAEADRLVAQVMAERGYPMGDFEQRAADVSVNHATVVADYRDAHAIAQRQARGEASTEELRQAMVHYRSLFADLLGDRAQTKETVQT